MSTKHYPAPGAVLPHRASLLLLTKVSTCSEQSFVGLARVGAHSKLAACGWVPSIVVVEMAAQAAAYHASLPGFLGGATSDEKGFLVRVRGVEIEQGNLPVAEDVELLVELVGRAGGLALYEFSASWQQQGLANGTLSILRG